VSAALAGRFDGMGADLRVDTGEKAWAADGAMAYGPVGRSRWLDVDWREHQSWVLVEGQPLNVIELGPRRTAPREGSGEQPAQGPSGQPVVFVHGLSGCWANWLEQLPVLAERHRVVALDLPGFGHSPMPAQGNGPGTGITISGYARLLDGLLGELGVDAAAVVGNSMGGFISAELAIAFPQRVERLVLVSAAGVSTAGHRGTTRALPAMRALETALLGTAAWVASKSDAAARRARLREMLMSLVVSHPGRLPATLAAEQMRGAGKPGFMQALEATLGYEVRERLPEIACPTLIVWGARDRLIPVRDADVFASLIPRSRKVVYPDTGHMAMLERPAAFNALLEEFLSE